MQFPCELCLSPSSTPLCNACYADLPWIESHCSHCRRGVTVQGMCVPCQQGAFSFDQAFIPFHYHGSIATLISQFKFNHQLHHARTLSHCFIQAAKDYTLPLPELLIPVPAHPKRVFERGFNQSIELTRFIAKALHVPWEARFIARIQNTPAQNKLKQQERRRNLKDAFALHKPRRVNHVALVDDVVTTGTTVNTLAQVLKEAGVERVDVWAICESVGKIS